MGKIRYVLTLLKLKWYFFLPILLGIIILATTLAIIKSKPSSVVNSPKPTSSPSHSAQLISFHVLSTNPTNNQQNVSAGEISISFTTDNPINSDKQFNMTISPKLPLYWKFVNPYPTNTVVAQVYGGLQPNTSYTVKVTDADGVIVYQWSFQTAAQAPVSSDLYVYDQAQKVIHDQFPLLPYLPYSNDDFSIDYTGPNNNTLEVYIENSNINNVKQEVANWIKSHGVNPNQQKYNYINDF